MARLSVAPPNVPWGARRPWQKTLEPIFPAPTVPNKIMFWIPWCSETSLLSCWCWPQTDLLPWAQPRGLRKLISQSEARHKRIPALGKAQFQGKMWTERGNVCGLWVGQLNKLKCGWLNFQAHCVDQVIPKLVLSCLNLLWAEITSGYCHIRLRSGEFEER